MTVLDGQAAPAAIVPFEAVNAAIDDVFREEVTQQAKRLNLATTDRESPGEWINRVRKAALRDAVATCPEAFL
jgi:hypothetical protein